MNKKQMNLNLCFTILSFLVSIGLNFYITPLISGELKVMCGLWLCGYGK